MKTDEKISNMVVEDPHQDEEFCDMIQAVQEHVLPGEEKAVRRGGYIAFQNRKNRTMEILDSLDI